MLRRSKGKSGPGGPLRMTHSGSFAPKGASPPGRAAIFAGYSGLATSRTASFSRIRADLPERPRR